MAMVITLKDDAAARASELAAAAGVSTDEVVAQLVLATTSPAATPTRRRLALASIGATEHGITTRMDDDLADGFGQD
jgi:hypothetical protein